MAMHGLADENGYSHAGGDDACERRGTWLGLDAPTSINNGVPRRLANH